MTIPLARKPTTFRNRKDEREMPAQLSTLFRSAHYPSGATRRLGNMHMHLDCSKSATSETRLVEVAQTLEQQGWPSKVSRVNYAKPGLHLSHPDYAEQYLQHTPELCAGENTFAAYLTTLLAAEVSDPEQVKSLCKQAREIMATQTEGFSEADMVIEVERVTALIDANDIHVASPAVMPKNDNTDRALYEIHHFVDFPHSMSIVFDEWQALCNLSGIIVGGWFQFDKENARAFRSVRFAKTLDMIQLIGETRELANFVCQQVGARPEEMRIETIVEQVVDIWRV